jgi:hypothetical protein
MLNKLGEGLIRQTLTMSQTEVASNGLAVVFALGLYFWDVRCSMWMGGHGGEKEAVVVV